MAEKAPTSMSRLPLRFLLLAFIFGSGSKAEPVAWDALHGLNEVKYHKLDREGEFTPLHIFVRLPAEYDPTSSATYPTAFLLDGGLMFPVLAGYQRHLELAEDAPALIVVGISYGTDDWQKGNARSTDFTDHAPDRDHWGGASEFLPILLQQIIPLVEENYAVDSHQRILFGQSIAGQFVLYTAMHAPDAFHGLIANNPALHRNLPVDLAAPSKVDHDSPPRLLVTSGEFDDPRFREPAQKWIKHWTASEKSPWALRAITTQGHNHFSAAPAAYRHGLRWILALGQSVGD